MAGVVTVPDSWNIVMRQDVDGFLAETLNAKKQATHDKTRIGMQFRTHLGIQPVELVQSVSIVVDRTFFLSLLQAGMQKH